MTRETSPHGAASKGTMIRTTALPLLIIVWMAGCVRRDGLNSDCGWPGETGAKALNPRQPGSGQHLSNDAELAEELAVRYADTHYGLRSGHFESREVYAQARNRCMGAMFEEIGKAHGVKPEEVFSVLGRNRAGIDLAVNLPFVLLYGFAASLMVRRIRGRYPLEEGWMAGVAMAVLCSLAFGAGGVLLGEQWSTAAESARLGSAHLSYRVDRLPWVRYRGWLFAFSVVLFWFIAALRYRTGGRRS